MDGGNMYFVRGALYVGKQLRDMEVQMLAIVS